MTPAAYERSMRIGWLILVLSACGFTGCIWDFRPAYITDPATQAETATNLRGDRHDRIALDQLHDRGAKFASGSFEPEADAAVVREALRVVPPSAGRGDMEGQDALVMLLLRRAHAAYVALAASMRSPSADVRAGAIERLGQLDARRGVRFGGPRDAAPLWPGPERDGAIAAAGSLLMSDPVVHVRQAAAHMFRFSIGQHPVPSAAELVEALGHESDAGIRDTLLHVLPLHGATPSMRLDAVDKYASDNVQAWMALGGLILEENRAVLESAYRRGGVNLRHGILREAEDESGTPQWLEGLILLGLADADVVLRDAAAHLALAIPTLSPELLRSLHATADSSGWAHEVLEKRAPK